MTPLDLFLYVLAACIGLALGIIIIAVLVGGAYILGHIALDRMMNEKPEA